MTIRSRICVGVALVIGAAVTVSPVFAAGKPKAGSNLATAKGSQGTESPGGGSTESSSSSTTSKNQVAVAGATQQQLANPAGLAQVLQSSYVTLAVADHDYDGHRDGAMKDIAAASELLGFPIAGQGAGHEPRPLSDLQLRSVQMNLLAVARSDASGAHHKEITNRINGAVNQITLALASEHPHPVGGAPGTGGNPVVGAGPVEGTNPVGGSSVEVASLEQIYQILSVADHDYKGHRRGAMGAISRACMALGGSINGDGRGHEVQTISDAQLQQGLTLLTQVRDSFSAADPKKVQKDLTSAVTQLTDALATK